MKPALVAVLGGTLAVSLVAIAALLVQQRRSRREQFIRTYSFPPGLFERLGKVRPDLPFKDIALTSRALRHFFLAYLKSGCRFVSMPSQVADDLWHEFILYTKNYEVFCRHAFGRFLHHTPAVVLGPDRNGNAGLRRAWWWCCREENIDPRRPSRLPLLFALDAKMNIADGFRYAPDCRRGFASDGRRGDSSAYCGTDFSDSNVDGGLDGFGADGGGFSFGNDGGSSDGGGHGGGDGGGGDSGSGCGGGD